MVKVTVIRNTGIREKYTPENFVETFKHYGNTYFVDMNDDCPADFASRWIELVQTAEAKDMDDLVLAEIPGGSFIELGRDINDRTFDEDGNNVRPYVENRYYITTDDGQDPSGPFLSPMQAYEEELKDLVEAERVHRYGAPDGYRIESGVDLNDECFLSVLPYDNFLYYIITRDRRDPVGGYKTEFEAKKEAWRMVDEKEKA